MPSTDRPERVEATNRAYIARYIGLVQRTARENEVSKPTPLDVVRFAESIASSLAAATWRQYRAALRAGLNTEVPSPERERAAALLETIKREPGGRPAALRTSAQKKKQTKADEIEELFMALELSEAKKAQPLLAILRGTMIVGCRPCEWWGAMIETDYPRITLTLLNAKATNGRANGETRLLAWNCLPDLIRESIVATVELANKFESRDAWTVESAKLQRLLHDVSREIWPTARRHYSIYSFRHRFAALAKSIFSPEIVAGLMGHASDATAARNYARAGSRIGRMLIEMDAGLPTPTVGPVRAKLEARRSTLVQHFSSSTTDGHSPPIPEVGEPATDIGPSSIARAVLDSCAQIDEFPVPKPLRAKACDAEVESSREYFAEQARIWEMLLAPYTLAEPQQPSSENHGP